MKTEYIKCGRKEYPLRNGESILDNNACAMLITVREHKDWHDYSPSVSKAAFRKFKANPRVSINHKAMFKYHNTYGYGDDCTIWTYRIPKLNRKLFKKGK